MSSAQRILPPLRPTNGRVATEVLQIAHRGNGGTEDYQPASLARIAALGTHLVEIDIRMTGDGHLVVHHDPEVVTDTRSAAINATSMHDLARLVPERVQSADAVIRAADHAGLGLYLDIKDVSESALDQLIGLLAAEDLMSVAILASADATIVAQCAAVAPSVPRSVLFRSVEVDPIELARVARADFVHPCWEAEFRPDKLVAGRWLDGARRHGLGVICWHEERPDVLVELIALGVDGICTNDPALLADLVAPVS
jgi:glycerophosphoryl diester phosphodiesterase